jgi:ribokinase
MACHVERTRTSTNEATADSLIVAVVGGVMMDWIFETGRNQSPGENTTDLPLARLPGGKGANIALSTYRASHLRPAPEGQGPRTTTASMNSPPSDVRVFLNAAVGDDEDGEALRRALEADGLDCDGVIIAEGETGKCKVTVDAETKVSRGTRMGGSRAEYAPRDLTRIETLTGTTGERPDLLIVGLEIPPVVIQPLLQIAAKAGVETMLNPSPVRPLQTTTFAHVTHLVLNEVEAAKMSGLSAEELKSDTQKQHASAKRFISMGVKNVVLTLGEKGVYYLTASGESGNVPAVKGVVVVDTTGAG